MVTTNVDSSRPFEVLVQYNGRPYIVSVRGTEHWAHNMSTKVVVTGELLKQLGIKARRMLSLLNG